MTLQNPTWSTKSGNKYLWVANKPGVSVLFHILNKESASERVNCLYNQLLIPSILFRLIHVLEAVVPDLVGDPADLKCDFVYTHYKDGQSNTMFRNQYHVSHLINWFKCRQSIVSRVHQRTDCRCPNCKPYFNFRFRPRTRPMAISRSKLSRQTRQMQKMWVVIVALLHMPNKCTVSVNMLKFRFPQSCERRSIFAFSSKKSFFPLKIMSSSSTSGIVISASLRMLFSGYGILLYYWYNILFLARIQITVWSEVNRS